MPADKSQIKQFARNNCTVEQHNGVESVVYAHPDGVCPACGFDCDAVKEWIALDTFAQEYAGDVVAPPQAADTAADIDQVAKNRGTGHERFVRHLL